MMKRKMISAVLAAVMTVGMITGCGSSQTTTENKADKADKLESQTDLSSTDYDFEKEYAYGDFNAHSRADEDRQDGIDTFEDKDIVFQDITYDQLIDILGSEGNYMIQLSGSWCHNSRAMSPFINKYAKSTVLIQYTLMTLTSTMVMTDLYSFVCLMRRQHLEQS